MQKMHQAVPSWECNLGSEVDAQYELAIHLGLPRGNITPVVNKWFVLCEVLKDLADSDLTGRSKR